MKKKLIIKKLIIFAFVIFFVGSYINQLITMRKIENEIATKQSQLEEIQEKNERLQEEVEKINSNSADYLEKLARERLGMIKPGEKVVNSSDENNKVPVWSYIVRALFLYQIISYGTRVIIVNFLPNV